MGLGCFELMIYNRLPVVLFALGGFSIVLFLCLFPFVLEGLERCGPSGPTTIQPFLFMFGFLGLLVLLFLFFCALCVLFFWIVWVLEGLGWCGPHSNRTLLSLFVFCFVLFVGLFSFGRVLCWCYKRPTPTENQKNMFFCGFWLLGEGVWQKESQIPTERNKQMKRCKCFPKIHPCFYLSFSLPFSRMCFFNFLFLLSQHTFWKQTEDRRKSKERR